MYDFSPQEKKRKAEDHEKVTSWASAMEHMTFGLALCKSKKIARKHCAKNGRIPALGYGAVNKPRSLAQVSDHFVHNFFSQFSSICTMHGRKSRTPSQGPMTSPSRDPMRPDHATFMGAQR